MHQMSPARLQRAFDPAGTTAGRVASYKCIPRAKSASSLDSIFATARRAHSFVSMRLARVGRHESTFGPVHLVIQQVIR